MARRLLLCKVNVLVGRPAFDDLAAAAQMMGLPWHVALERLEAEVKATAEARALEVIAEWLQGSCNHSPMGEPDGGLKL